MLPNRRRGLGVVIRGHHHDHSRVVVQCPQQGVPRGIDPGTLEVPRHKRRCGPVQSGEGGDFLLSAPRRADLPRQEMTVADRTAASLLPGRIDEAIPEGLRGGDAEFRQA